MKYKADCFILSNLDLLDDRILSILFEINSEYRSQKPDLDLDFLKKEGITFEECHRLLEAIRLMQKDRKFYDEWGCCETDFSLERKDLELLNKICRISILIHQKPEYCRSHEIIKFEEEILEVADKLEDLINNTSKNSREVSTEKLTKINN